MSLRKLVATMAGVAALALTVVAAPAASAESSAALARTITVSGGGEYAGYVPQAIQVWNSRVPNIRMVQTSGAGNIRISVTSGGGSRATIGHGSGQIILDRLQINEGYSPLRVITHEMGHTLGLRDNYNGNCNILMSGGSAGYSCRNVYPSAGEANWVNQSFANGRAAKSAEPTEWVVEPTSFEHLAALAS
ncbi:snapalysin [Lentzea waywayandensis]|uniref:Extracellular small neutral protease n=1 Tax=Lentzea waywayandensis TaxID=84724 RepID=A0A1I6DL63_9PSEU|nr:snapalysin family zinc-dependent metalloprotease [Lentzea waywayandensis]SFR06098.1 snapalysin [Lentzea waywayandensis]